MLVYLRDRERARDREINRGERGEKICPCKLKSNVLIPTNIGIKRQAMKIY